MFQLQLLKVVLVDFGLCGNEERYKWIFFFGFGLSSREKSVKLVRYLCVATGKI